MNNFPAIGLIVTLSLLFAGCDTVPKTELNETLASETAAATEEAFVALNEDAQEAVECAAFFTRTLPDGRLEVAVNLHNLGDKPLRLKTNCVFKDATGVWLKDETPARTIELVAGAIETVRFTTANAVAQRYTVWVQAVR